MLIAVVRVRNNLENESFIDSPAGSPHSIGSVSKADNVPPRKAPWIAGENLFDGVPALCAEVVTAVTLPNRR